jgi:ATP-dependent Clp protease ATP-binding subunit ClpC
MFERFTDRARRVMQLANQEAKRLNHEYIGTEHILLGLVKEGSGVAGRVLKDLGADLGKVRLEVERVVRSGPDQVTMSKLPQTPLAKRVIEHAIEEARNLKHNYVGTEHLLLGLLREEGGIGGRVLLSAGLGLEQMRGTVVHIIESSQRRPASDVLTVAHGMGLVVHVVHPILALVGAIAFVLGIALGSWLTRNPGRSGT